MIMFKKILAGTVIAACASTASAAVTLSLAPDFTASSTSRTTGGTVADGATAVAPIHTIEGLFGATTMDATNAGIKLSAANIIVAGDVITITYTQPFSATATAAATLLVSMPGTGATSADTMTLSRSGASAVGGATSVAYSVASIEYNAGVAGSGSGNNDTDGAIIISDPGLTFAPCTAACTVKMNASISRNGTVIEAAAAAGLTVGSVVQQFKTNATGDENFNTIIDVGALRKAFTDTGTADESTINISEVNKTDGKTVFHPAQGGVGAGGNATITSKEATESGSVVVVTGTTGFGFLDCIADAGTTATDNIQLSGAPCTGTNVLGGDANWDTTAPVLKANELTFTADAASDRQFEFDVDSQNTAIIPVQTVSGTWTVSYASASSDLSTTAITHAMGGFTMNGSSTKIYAVPYGPGVQQYLWVTNEGTASGSITATAFDTSGTAYPTTGEYDLGTLAATTHKAIAADLLAKLKADGMDDTVSQRLQIALTVTLPQANVNVYAAYRSGDARLALDTSAGKDSRALLATATALTTAEGKIDTAILDIDTTCDNIVTAEANLDGIAGASNVFGTAAAASAGNVTAAGAAATINTNNGTGAAAAAMAAC
jgi:hypothetical protein